MTAENVVFVGGGFRTTTFLASAPELLDQHVTVIERGSHLVPSGFASYTVTSTSAGSKFFAHVSRERFNDVLTDPLVANVAFSEKPVAMSDLAAALSILGSRVARLLGDRLILGHPVERVEIDSVLPGVTVVLDDRQQVRSDHAVLATGRTERPHPALDRWRAKTWQSGRVISWRHREQLIAHLADADGGDLVIAGCSHSAMSALGVVLQARSQLRQECPGYRGPVITVLRRSPSRLMYESLDAARAGQVPGRERIVRSSADVCPDTGIAYRDSGLRHESRHLFCDLWAGRIDDARVNDVVDLSEEAALLDRASLVIQALGYRGVAPDIVLDGQLLRPNGSAERLVADDDGAVLINGAPHPSLSVLRVEPTPLELRDHTAYGSKLYTRLAVQLRRQLSGAARSGG